MQNYKIICDYLCNLWLILILSNLNVTNDKVYETSANNVLYPKKKL